MKERIDSIKEGVDLFEKELGVKFPKSYHQFLLVRGSDLVDGFKILGIPKKEQFEVEGPSLKEKEIKEPELDFEKVKESHFCPLCQKEKQTGRIICFSCFKQYSRETNRQKPLALWVKERLSIRKKEEQKKKTEEKTKQERKAEKQELSVVEATEMLRRRRPDLPENLVAIIFIKNTYFLI